MARLFYIALWNECDDQGSFEWSPIKLKMRLIPADTADAAQLLSELIEGGSVLRYEVAGKAYGAVRNFCQYQRPKKPNSTYPQTEEVRKWVNIDARLTRDGSELVGNQFPTNGEKSRQRKEEGGRMKEKDNANALSTRARNPFPMPHGVDPNHWRDFLKNRKQKNLSNTESSHKRMMDDIARLTDDEWPPPKLIEYAAGKGWGGIYDPRKDLESINGTTHRNSTASGRIGKPDGFMSALREVTDAGPHEPQPDTS